MHLSDDKRKCKECGSIMGAHTFIKEASTPLDDKPARYWALSWCENCDLDFAQEILEDGTPV